MFFQSRDSPFSGRVILAARIARDVRAVESQGANDVPETTGELAEVEQELRIAAQLVGPLELAYGLFETPRRLCLPRLLDRRDLWRRRVGGGRSGTRRPAPRYEEPGQEKNVTNPGSPTLPLPQLCSPPRVPI